VVSKTPVTPTQLSRGNMQARGYLVALVEHRVPGTGRRVTRDLFGFIDLLGVGDAGTLAVQTTDSTNMSKRVAKIRESENLHAVKQAGWRVEVHGWYKPKLPGLPPAVRIVVINP